VALVLLDTTVLIDYMRGRPACARVDALEAAGDVPCTTAVNVEELARGLRGRETQSAQPWSPAYESSRSVGTKAGRRVCGGADSPRAA
jgi:predicted nucleic acid-binding protein